MYVLVLGPQNCQILSKKLAVGLVGNEFCSAVSRHWLVDDCSDFSLFRPSTGTFRFFMAQNNDYDPENYRLPCWISFVRQKLFPQEGQ